MGSVNITVSIDELHLITERLRVKNTASQSCGDSFGIQYQVSAR
jgi:hypothetical protein